MTENTSEARKIAADEQWPSFALARGTIVNGYRITRILGSGGFGITYLASDLLEQQFAIKEYYPRQFATRRDLTVQPCTAADEPLFDECKDRFLREAHALVRLGRVAGATDGIVRVQTYFEAFGTGFLVMDYVAGENLAAVLQREPGGLVPLRVRSVLLQLLASVRIVHQAGLLHRDIKPANIILRENERLVLIDFGATRLSAPTDTTSYTQIYSGGYAPPEQMLGLRQAEFSDIYAIGAVCYRAIGGSLANSLARQNSLSAGRPDPLVSAVTVGAGRYPRPLLLAIDAALAVDPTRRPPNVDALLALLPPEEAVEKRRPAPDRSRPWRLAPRSAIAGSLIIAAGIVFWLFLRSAAPPTVMEAKAPAPPPPTQTPAASEPEPSAATPAPIIPEPQREALAPLPPPSPAPVVSPFEQVKAMASSLSCAALSVSQGGDAVRVSGFAEAGQPLNDVLMKAQETGRVVDAVSRMDRFACAPLAILAPLIQRTWNAGSPEIALRPEQGGVTIGGRLVVNLLASKPALYLDLYQPDGSVRHLLHPNPSGSAARKTVEWTATSPAGQRLLVAISATKALELGARAESESASIYLDTLRKALGEADQADLAMVIVRAGEPGLPKPPPTRQNNVRSERCANIVSRAQLGETLSNAEVSALQNECRS